MCRDLVSKDPSLDIVALNFASAKNPGGGFLKGSLAQEESIASSSALYSCLIQPRVSAYYDENRKDRTCLYTHHIIYSSKVPVFRDDNFVLLEQPYCCSFITSPAVNTGHASERVGVERVKETIIERIDRVLGVAVENNHSVIVLGAWGCGVFANDTGTVASYFRYYLNASGKYGKAFSRVVFAIPDDPKLREFQLYFESGKNPTTSINPARQNKKTYNLNKNKKNYQNNNRKEKRLNYKKNDN